MKKIILMRHSIPKRMDIPTEFLPLSDEGKELINKCKKNLIPLRRCFSSPYRRAFETALWISDTVEINHKLHERVAGEAGEDFWLKQYTDHDYKNPGGESLNEVKIRMFQAVNEVLEKIEDGDTAAVVSHATAICAYLMNFCDVQVSDEKSKARKVIFRGKEVMNSPINPTSYFVLEYSEDNEIENISFCQTDQI